MITDSFEWGKWNGEKVRQTDKRDKEVMNEKCNKEREWNVEEGKKSLIKNKGKKAKEIVKKRSNILNWCKMIFCQPNVNLLRMEKAPSYWKKV